jgi:hypothetical protein
MFISPVYHVATGMEAQEAPLWKGWHTRAQ